MRLRNIRPEAKHGVTSAIGLLVIVMVMVITVGCGGTPSGVPLTDAMIADALVAIEAQEMPDYSGWQMQETESGIRYAVLASGTGPVAWYDDKVRVHHNLWMTDGRLMDSTRKDGVVTPLEFTVGEGRVIRGWEDLALEMNAGSKVLAVIPWKLGYGKNYRRGIPGKSDLVFYVEMLKIR